MLSFLKGNVHAKQITSGHFGKLIVDVGGVGFEAIVSERTLHTVGQAGSPVTLNTCLSVRENEWTLFGFLQIEERELFTLLQSVSGVGPKVALALVATIESTQLAQAIVSGNHKTLSQAPSVGTKMAQRLCLELKPKIEEWLEQRSLTVSVPQPNKAIQEVQEILSGLGYTGTEIAMVLQTVTADPEVLQDVESMVAACLRTLNVQPVQLVNAASSTSTPA
jgi:holliday junction DNA helicase RuvA